MEEQVAFPAGDITLEGLWSLPSQAPQIGVIVCHPHPLYGGDMRNTIVSALVDGFRGAGMATLRFNFRGVGQSGGTHDDGRAEQDDVKAAVSCLLNRQAVSTLVVAGYSFGSMVGLRAGAQDARVHKLIGVALPVGARDASFLQGVNKPKLLISGDQDEYAPVAKLRQLVAALPDPKSLVMIDGADHFLGGHEEQIATSAVAFLAGEFG